MQKCHFERFCIDFSSFRAPQTEAITLPQVAQSAQLRPKRVFSLFGTSVYKNGRIFACSYARAAEKWAQELRVAMPEQHNNGTNFAVHLCPKYTNMTTSNFLLNAHIYH